MRSSFPQKEGRDIPLQAFLPQTLAIINNAYRQKHSIITQHRRIMMIARASEAVADEEEEPPAPEYNYKLTVMRAYRWVPDYETGQCFRLPNTTVNLPAFVRTGDRSLPASA